MDRNRLQLLQQRQCPFSATPPPNWHRTRTGRENVPEPPNESTETAIYILPDGTWDTWEYSPPPPSTPVDRSKGILRYRESYETYGQWPGRPRKSVRFAENHHTRWYQKDVKESRRTRFTDLVNQNQPQTSISYQNYNSAAVLERPNPPEPEMPVLIESAQPKSPINREQPASTTSTPEGPFEECNPSEDSLTLTGDVVGCGEINSNVFSANSENTQGFYRNSEEEVVLTRNSIGAPLCQELSDCDDPIKNIVNELTPSEFSAALLQHLSDYGITTIGHLSSMRPCELQPFAMHCTGVLSKAENAKNVLRQYRAALLEAQVGSEEFSFGDEDSDSDLEEYVEDIGEPSSPPGSASENTNEIVDVDNSNSTPPPVSSSVNTDEAHLDDDENPMPKLVPMNSFRGETENSTKSLLENSQIQLRHPPVLRTCVHTAKVNEEEPGRRPPKIREDDNWNNVRDILFKAAPIILTHRGRKRKSELEGLWTAFDSTYEQIPAMKTRKRSSSQNNSKDDNKEKPAGVPLPHEPPSNASNGAPKLTKTRNRKQTLRPSTDESHESSVQETPTPDENENCHSELQKKKETRRKKKGVPLKPKGKRGRRKSAITKTGSNEWPEMRPNPNINYERPQRSFSQPVPMPLSSILPKVIVKDCKKYPPPELAVASTSSVSSVSSRGLHQVAGLLQASPQILSKEVNQGRTEEVNSEETQSVSRTSLDSTNATVSNVQIQDQHDEHDENRNRITLSSPSVSSGPEAEQLPPVQNVRKDAEDQVSMSNNRNTLEPGVLREIQALIRDRPEDVDADFKSREKEIQAVLPKLLLTHAKVKTLEGIRKYAFAKANNNNVQPAEASRPQPEQPANHCTKDMPSATTTANANKETLNLELENEKEKESEIDQPIAQMGEEMELNLEDDIDTKVESFAVIEEEEVEAEVEEEIGRWEQILDEMRMDGGTAESKRQRHYHGILLDALRGMGMRRSIEIMEKLSSSVSKCRKLEKCVVSE